MTIESFSFDKGINRKKSSLLLTEGELYSCSGFSFEHDGILECRTAKTRGILVDSNITKSPVINGIHRYEDSIYVSTNRNVNGEITTLYNQIWHRLIGGSAFTFLSYSGNLALRPRFDDYGKFTFVVDGVKGRAFTEEHKYNWGIAAPSAPTIAAGTAGIPNGTYDCYVTLYATFANGQVMETAPSTKVSITVATKKIEWSNIPIGSVSSGDTPTFHRKLYRTVQGIPYLVTTIEDNTTTTYSDNMSNVNLQAKTVLSTDDYTIPPQNAVDLVAYLNRIFVIADNKVYWSEPYLPFNFVDTSYMVVSREDENLVSLINWGDQLYFASAREWYRLQGNDPDMWALKRTWTDVGVINRHCTQPSKYGIIGLWNDGIYLFDGSTGKNITEKILGKQYFTDLEDLSGSFSEFDGRKYYFYYSTATGITVDSCMVLDFTYYPELRVYNQDFFPHAHFYYKETDTNYYGKDNYEYSDGGTEVIPTSLKTGDKAFGAIVKRKCLDYLYYDIYTDNKDVTVDIYADGEIVQTLTLNTNQRTRKRSVKLRPTEGYRFAIGIDCSNSQNLLIYTPWALEATPVGE